MYELKRGEHVCAIHRFELMNCNFCRGPIEQLTGIIDQESQMINLTESSQQWASIGRTYIERKGDKPAVGVVGFVRSEKIGPTTYGNDLTDIGVDKHLAHQFCTNS